MPSSSLEWPIREGGLQLPDLQGKSDAATYGRAVSAKPQPRAQALVYEAAGAARTSPRIGYFAGCMTMLSPKILRAMETIFAAGGDDVFWADRDGGVCCGRPLKLAGEVAAARKMMAFNKELFEKSGVTTLVTSCPICLKVFREDYDLEGIEVLHHTQYIARLMAAGRLAVAPTDELYTYHDPCELGRGCGIYDEPREVIAVLGQLKEPSQTREHAFCCGASLANVVLDDDGQRLIGEELAREFTATGAGTVVTACPLCRKSIAAHTPLEVRDIAEVVAGAVAR